MGGGRGVEIGFTTLCNCKLSFRGGQETLSHLTAFWLSQPKGISYSVMQSDGNSFSGDVVLDSINMAQRDLDSILNQMYQKQMFQDLFMKILNDKSDSEKAYLQSSTSLYNKELTNLGFGATPMVVSISVKNFNLRNIKLEHICFYIIGLKCCLLPQLSVEAVQDDIHSKNSQIAF